MEQAADVVVARRRSPNVRLSRRGTDTSEARSWYSAFVERVRRHRYALQVYISTRVLLLVVAGVDIPLQHFGFKEEVTNWDGYWYTAAAQHGYPTAVLHTQTTLGFFPLYPMGIWLVHRLPFLSAAAAGVVIAEIGGLVATLLIERLALGWWGPDGARRAVVVFCVFPGSVVFSMAYSEGVLIPLAAGCLLALQQRRWILAGVLAGLATAVGPDALPVILVCAVSAGSAWRRARSGGESARGAVFAPLLSLVGVGAFGLFLWTWAGSPFASLVAQHDGWGERSDVLALYRQARTLAHEISFSHFNYHAVNLNYVVGLLGAIVLVIGIVLMFQRPFTVSLEARIWTLGVGLLSVTSEYVPPNPRLLLTTFPVLLVIAHRLSRRGYQWLVGVNVVFLIVLSAISYAGIALRP
jgi:hypothetical protein